MITDLEMPRAGGREVVAAAVQKRVPVVVLTGHATVQTAVELMRKEPFDLMVLDYKMPGMSGFEVFEHARTLHPTMAVVLVTGHGTPEIVNEANRMGFHAILLKPFTSDELRGTVEKVLADRG